MPSRDKHIETERNLEYSIVIPAKNAQATLPDLLACLDAQIYPHNAFECIVVNDGSTDNTSVILESWKPDIASQIIQHPLCYGRSYARNAGREKAGGEIVVFLDADMRPADDWLTEIDAKFARESLDVVSGHVTAGDGDYNGQHAHPVFSVLQSQLRDWDLHSSPASPWVYAAFASNLAIRRSVLERVNGFNTFFPRFEDIELNLRLWEAKARYGYASLAHAHHAGPSQLDTWITGENLSRLFVRHPYRHLLAVAAWSSIQLVKSDPNLEDGARSLHEALELSERAGRDLFGLVEQAYNSLPAIDCRHTIDDIIDAAKYRSYLTPENALPILDHALASGLYSEVRNGIRLFDMQHSMNWLARCSEARMDDYPKPESAYSHTPYQRTMHPGEALAFHCTGTYEITMPSSILAKFPAGVKINIPLPIEHASQKSVSISKCIPSTLLDSWKEQQGMFVRHPVTSAGEETVKISYDFEYDIFEHVPGSGTPCSTEAPVNGAYLNHGLPDAYIDKATAILSRLIPDATVDAYSKVRSLFEWVWMNFEFMEFPLPFYELIDTGYGGCASTIKLLVSLLRLAGIPSREQGGIFISNGYYTGPSLSYTREGIGSSLFVHTWAEFYALEHGWIPICEFESPIRLAFVAMLPEEDRLQVLGSSRRRYRAIFGSISPFRTYGSEQAIKLPTYPLVKTDRGWIADPELIAATSHKVSYQMEQIF